MAEEGAAAQPSAIHIVTETRNLKSTPFIIPEDNNIIGREWEDWLDGIEREFRYFKITNSTNKKDALIIYGGKEIGRLEKSLPDPTDGNAYEKLKTKLNNYFVPKQNKHHARYQFLKEKPANGESITAYTARLREKAKKCEFGEVNDERILEHIIQTIDNKAIIQKTISRKWSLTQFLQEVSQIEDVNRQVTEMKTHQEEGNNVARVGTYKPNSSRTRGSRTKYRKQNQPQEHGTQKNATSVTNGTTLHQYVSQQRTLINNEDLPTQGKLIPEKSGKQQQKKNQQAQTMNISRKLSKQTCTPKRSATLQTPRRRS